MDDPVTIGGGAAALTYLAARMLTLLVRMHASFADFLKATTKTHEAAAASLEALAAEAKRRRLGAAPLSKE